MLTSTIKKDIKDIKAKLKTVALPATRDIYERHLAELEQSLRHMKLVDKVEKAGFVYDEWLVWAKSLYDISYVESPNAAPTSYWQVTSKARDWNEEVKWELHDEQGCLEKIAELIGYKIYDRHRGRGDIDKDMESANQEA